MTTRYEPGQPVPLPQRGTSGHYELAPTQTQPALAQSPTATPHPLGEGNEDIDVDEFAAYAMAKQLGMEDSDAHHFAQFAKYHMTQPGAAQNAAAAQSSANFLGAAQEQGRLAMGRLAGAAAEAPAPYDATATRNSIMDQMNAAWPAQEAPQPTSRLERGLAAGADIANSLGQLYQGTHPTSVRRPVEPSHNVEMLRARERGEQEKYQAGKERRSLVMTQMAPALEHQERESYDQRVRRFIDANRAIVGAATDVTEAEERASASRSGKTKDVRADDASILFGNTPGGEALLRKRATERDEDPDTVVAIARGGAEAMRAQAAARYGTGAAGQARAEQSASDVQFEKSVGVPRSVFVDISKDVREEAQSNIEYKYAMPPLDTPEARAKWLRDRFKVAYRMRTGKNPPATIADELIGEAVGEEPSEAVDENAMQPAEPQPLPPEHEQTRQTLSRLYGTQLTDDPDTDMAAIIEKLTEAMEQGDARAIATYDTVIKPYIEWLRSQGVE